jgi:ribosomal protein L9
MKVQIIKPTRIEKGKAGDIVEVSPDRARFLIRYGLAEPVTVRERIETPEKRTAKKTTRGKK